MKKKSYAPGVSHDACVIEELRANPEFAVELLKVTLEEIDEEGGDYAFLKTLQLIAKSQGLGKIARKAGIPPESLSRALSPRGNPRFSTLLPVMRALGVEFTIRS